MKTIIVGNGGSLLGRGMGKHIDSYDCVVRMNRCVTAGFEADVGQGTDVWAVSYHGGIGRFDPPDNVRCSDVRWICFMRLQERGSLNCRELGFNGFELNTHQSAAFVASVCGDYYCSTGILAVAQFMPCDVIGFDHWSGKNHYSDDSPKKNGANS